MNPALLLLVPLGLVLVLVWRAANWQSQKRIQSWASERGFELLQSRICVLNRAPFMLSSSRTQSVYWIVVRDALGQACSGWICMGSYWPFMEDEFNVQWNGSSSPHLR